MAHQHLPQSVDDLAESDLWLMDHAPDCFEIVNNNLDALVGAEAQRAETEDSGPVYRWVTSALALRIAYPQMSVLDQRDAAINLAAAAIQRLAQQVPRP